LSFLYVYERGAKIGVQNNCVVVESEKDNLKRTLPIEGVENVVIFGDATLSTSSVRHFMERDINLTWLSSKGKFYGRLESTRNVDIYRQRRQFACGEDEAFCLALSKNIVAAKVKNQITILRRYQRNRPDASVQKNVEAMSKLLPVMGKCKSKNELMGYEGIAARNYYQGLGALVDEEFLFSGRSKQPPRDPFNSLLSFAYTLLMYDVYTAAVNRGLNPYASFLHSIRRGHPALCSDLMEEWRAILADSLALYVTNKGIIKYKDFEKVSPEGGVYLVGVASKTYIAEYEKKVRTRSQYINYVDYKVSFRRGIEMQCQRLARAIEEGDPSIYQPVVIR
jgi:CRISPR-associated protein Cas1